MAFTAAEEYRLHAFRRAAVQIHDPIDRHWGHRFVLHMLRRDREDVADLLPRDTFIALLVAVRLVYGQQQEANLPRVHNIVFQNGDQRQRHASTAVRRSWDNVLASRTIIQVPEGVFGPRDVLDTYLNGEFLHQDAELQAALEAMRRVGPFAEVMLQSSLWALGCVALVMDTVIADVFAEKPLARAPQTI